MKAWILTKCIAQFLALYILPPAAFLTLMIFFTEYVESFAKGIVAFALILMGFVIVWMLVEWCYKTIKECYQNKLKEKDLTTDHVDDTILSDKSEKKIMNVTAKTLTTPYRTNQFEILVDIDELKLPLYVYDKETVQNIVELLHEVITNGEDYYDLDEVKFDKAKSVIDDVCYIGDYSPEAYNVYWYDATGVKFKVEITVND